MTRRRSDALEVPRALEIRDGGVGRPLLGPGEVQEVIDHGVAERLSREGAAFEGGGKARKPKADEE